MPNNTGAMLGVREAKAAFQTVEPVLRDRLGDATEQTARVIAFNAQQRVRRRYGILADHIRYSMSRKTGVAKVGIGPRETIELPTGHGTEVPTHIAHLVEFGHGGPHPAEAEDPLMLPAAEGEKGNYLQR